MFEKLGVHDTDPKTEKEAMDKLTEEQLSYTALVNGQRGLYKGSTFYTHFCYSNPAARKVLVDFCVRRGLRCRAAAEKPLSCCATSG